MKIIRVRENSLAEQIGLKAGDRLLKINGKKVLDEIDYKFRFTEEDLSLDFEISGKMETVEVNKDYDEGLGVQFEEMKIRKCANDCVFCFVDQNPKGMREGMYFRDGDYRMSYLFGHYITMTNMGKNELNRIIEQKMSPLYISVHVIDEELRKQLFLYKKDDGLLEKINLLISNNIELHTQIVLMPGINDGKFLFQTLEALYKFHPKLKSCTIVPVGLTKHRNDLMKINTVDKKYAENLLGKLLELRKVFSGQGAPYVLLSDEWYIIANKKFPSIEEYGDIDLVENGVGQVINFLDNFYKESLNFPNSLKKDKKVTIITGMLIVDIFKKKILPILKNINGLTINIFPIINNFYGSSVTVTGLLTGQDIIKQLKNIEIGDEVWASHRILNDEGICTLDDMTLDDLSNELNCKFRVTNDSFGKLVKEMDND